MDAPIVAPAAPPTQIEVEVKLPKKEKKPRSDAQKAATEKALATLRERREAKAKEETTVSDAKIIAKQQVISHKKKNPGVALATREEVETLRGEITTLKGMLKPSAPAAAPAAPAAAAKTPAKTPAAPVKAATPVPSRPTTAERLTGKALLDSLFPPGGR
tara:strand:+ start:1397 stop:1876 length:480 start_codon:yes stop_codon:yes gene_type:complete